MVFRGMETLGRSANMVVPNEELERMNETENDLFYHALNYRGASSEHAELFWNELQECVNRLIAAEREAAMAAILDGCPNDGSDAEIILRRAWERVLTMRSNAEITGRTLAQNEADGA